MTLELDHPPAPTQLTDKLKARVIKDIARLMSKGEEPMIVAYEGETQLGTAVIFLPKLGSKPAQSFQGSLLDARELAAVRDKLRRPDL